MRLVHNSGGRGKKPLLLTVIGRLETGDSLMIKVGKPQTCYGLLIHGRSELPSSPQTQRVMTLMKPAFEQMGVLLTGIRVLCLNQDSLQMQDHMINSQIWGFVIDGLLDKKPQITIFEFLNTIQARNKIIQIFTSHLTVCAGEVLDVEPVCYEKGLSAQILIRSRVNEISSFQPLIQKGNELAFKIPADSVSSVPIVQLTVGTLVYRLIFPPIQSLNYALPEKALSAARSGRSSSSLLSQSSIAGMMQKQKSLSEMTELDKYLNSDIGVRRRQIEFLKGLERPAEQQAFDTRGMSEAAVVGTAICGTYYKEEAMRLAALNEADNGAGAKLNLQAIGELITKSGVQAASNVPADSGVSRDAELLKVPLLEGSLICDQVFRFEIPSKIQVTSKKELRLVRSSPVYLEEIEQSYYHLVEADGAFFLVYKTCFWDVGHELYLHISKEQGNVVHTDLFRLSARISCDRLLKSLLQLHETKDGFIFTNVLVDDFNYGERCRITISQKQLSIQGQLECNLSFSLQACSVKPSISGLLLVVPHRTYNIQLKYNKQPDLEALTILINLFRQQVNASMDSIPSKPEYVYSYEIIKGDLQVYYDLTLLKLKSRVPKTSGVVRAYVVGQRGFMARVHEGELQDAVQLNHCPGGFILAMELDGQFCQLFKLETSKQQLEQISQFLKGKAIEAKIDSRDCRISHRQGFFQLEIDLQPVIEMDLKNVQVDLGMQNNEVILFDEQNNHYYNLRFGDAERLRDAFNGIAAATAQQYQSV